MSFFGFDTSLPVATNEQHQEEDLAVYTWGADNYSNLGQALQEGRDEFNDETFGFSEAVGRAPSSGIHSPEQELTGTGKDFDFGNTVDIHAHQPKQSTQHTMQQHKTSHSTSGNTGNKPGKSFSAPQNSKICCWSLRLTYATFIASSCISCKMNNGSRSGWLDIRTDPGCAEPPRLIFDGYRLPLESRIVQPFLWAFSYCSFQRTAVEAYPPDHGWPKTLRVQYCILRFMPPCVGAVLGTFRH